MKPDGSPGQTAKRLFSGPVRFVAGASGTAALPTGTCPEIAFAGRSNVGKSTLINALARRKRLARISREPGRTRQLNCFDFGGRIWMVDMPGYGYARVARHERRDWQAAARDYLRTRPRLSRVLLLVDARRGIGALDEAFMALLDEAAIPWQLALTKIDCLGICALESVLEATRAALAAHPAALVEPAPTSARTGAGLDALRAEIAALADQAAPA